MDIAEAWILVGKQKALSEQLTRLADGTWATMRLRVETVYGGDIGFYWQPRGYYKRELAFAVPASECLDKTDEEITALVEKHIPGYLDRLEQSRAEQKRRQRLRVQRNNELIAWNREQTRKKITTCEAPGCKEPVTAVRASKRYCSAPCRQRANRRCSGEVMTSTDRIKMRYRPALRLLKEHLKAVPARQRLTAGLYASGSLEIYMLMDKRSGTVKHRVWPPLTFLDDILAVPREELGEWLKQFLLQNGFQI